jgi:hypothetical protein
MRVVMLIIRSNLDEVKVFKRSGTAPECLFALKKLRRALRPGHQSSTSGGWLRS